MNLTKFNKNSVKQNQDIPNDYNGVVSESEILTEGNLINTSDDTGPKLLLGGTINNELKNNIDIERKTQIDDDDINLLDLEEYSGGDSSSSSAKEGESTSTKSDTISEGNVKQISDNKQNQINAKIQIMDGGEKLTTYDIDYLIADDNKLINIIKVNNIVDKYIKNYYSENIQQYKQSFKNLYQKYSTKRHIINNIGNVITVLKNTNDNDVIKKKNNKLIKPEIVYELKKPLYLFYNNNNKLELLKRQISNNRADLQFLYQKLVNKLIV